MTENPPNFSLSWREVGAQCWSCSLLHPSGADGDVRHEGPTITQPPASCHHPCMAVAAVTVTKHCCCC